MIEQLEYGYNLRQRAERAELRAFLLNIALAGAEAEGERRGALIEELAESVHTARVQTLGVCDQVRTSEARVAELEARFTAPVVCMCGSTRFKQTWITENARLTSEGNIVLAVALWGHHERRDPDAQTKAALDELHKRKIDLCNWVWVLDVGGYIGESTQSEIEYATRLGRPVRYLSRECPGYQEPENPLKARVVELTAERNAYKRRCMVIEADLESARDRVAALEAERIRTQEDERVLTCVYCGHEYPPGTPASNHAALSAHIKKCPQHPLAQALARVAELEAWQVKAREVLERWMRINVVHSGYPEWRDSRALLDGPPNTPEPAP